MFHKIKYYAKFIFDDYDDLTIFMREFILPKDIMPDEFHVSYNVAKYDSGVEYSSHIHFDYNNNSLFYSKEQSTKLGKLLVDMELSNKSSFFNVEIITVSETNV